MKPVILTSWILQVLVAVILGQTLIFKFTGAEESVALFTELGMEPTGRILIGIAELVVVVLLLIPQSIIWGAILGWGVMSGAIMGHITKLGFEGERGQLAALAIVAWLGCTVIIYLRREQLPLIRSMFGRKSGN